MKHTCYNCRMCIMDFAEFGYKFNCGRDVRDMNIGCMDWAPFPPRGDKRVLIEAYRALKRGDPERAVKLIGKQLDFHEGAAYWESAAEVPK